MRRENKKRNKIIIALVAVLFLMSAGYAAFQTNLKINGTSKIASSWDIKITSVSSGVKTGNGENAKTPTWDNLTASMEANLYTKGDAVEYEVTVENKGTFDAKLEDISFGGGGNDAIKITTSGYTKGEKLYKNSSQKIKVKVEYNPNFEGTPTNNTNEVTINLNYGQASGSNVPTVNDYLLTYDCTTNGGNACTNNNEYLTEGKNIDLTKKGSKTGYTFVGWNTSATATTGFTSLTMPSKATTLYAIYKKTVTITYQKDTSVSAIGKTTDSCAMYNNATTCQITLPTITANTGYTLDGWYNGTTKVGNASASINVSSNGTYIAKANKITPSAPKITNSSNEEWTSEDVTITLNSEIANEVDRYEWKENEIWITKDLTTTNGVGTITYKTDMNQDIEFRLIDKEGNISKVATTTIKIEKIVPTLSVSTTKTTNSITVTANASAASGISKYEYSIDDGVTWVTGTGNTHTFSGLKAPAVASDQLKENVVTTGDGLYKDEYEEGRYLYRGGAPNNHITFNNEAWRIMSVESDDTLKIIKDEKLSTDMPYDTANARTAAYCNSSYGCNIWGSSTTMLDSAGQNVTKLPYQVGSTAYDLPTTEASINTYLNGTYYNRLEETSRNLITSHSFNTGVTSYAISQTIEAEINQSRSSKWNGNIGLISAPDYVRASTDASCTNMYKARTTTVCKNNNYLYKNYQWWTLSPDSNGSSRNVGRVDSVGYLNYNYANNSIGSRPVSHLSFNLFIAGEGTSANPYTISEVKPFSIKAKATSNSGKQATAPTTEVTLDKLSKPTFSETGTTTKSVKITYPSGCSSMYTCSYSKDGAAFTNVTSNPTINFTSSGTLVAKVTDGTNEVTTTYTVDIIKTAASQLKENIVTTGDGLYKDEYEEGRYLYRGTTPNNYITFNNEAWRIISIESDDTLKIIKDEKLANDMPYDTANARTAAYCTHPQYGCNMWGSSTTMLDSAGTNVTKLPYQVGSTAYDLPTTEASLNTYLNGTYYNGLEEASRNLITSHSFNTGVTLYGISQTIATEIGQTKSSKWNGNIGLISAPDYVRASTNTSCTNIYSARQSSYPCKNNNYLYKNYHWWTLSPYSYSGSYNVWDVYPGGTLTSSKALLAYGVVPVSHLSSNLFIAGEGTQANPYTIN